MNKSLLIIFIKNPVLGKAKTRLAATVGAEKALEIYRLLLNRTREITKGSLAHKALFYSDFIDAEDDWNPGIYQKYTQHGVNLGDRMQHAFAVGFALGYSRICIIGSDCYELTTAIIDTAFQNLEMNDVVLGPSTDGGYYLLGMNKLQESFFQNKNWSTDSVLSETINDAKYHGLNVALLPTLTDVDDEASLHSIPGYSLFNVHSSDDTR